MMAIVSVGVMEPPPMLSPFFCAAIGRPQIPYTKTKNAPLKLRDCQPLSLSEGFRRPNELKIEPLPVTTDVR